MHRPLLARRTMAGGENQWRIVIGIAPLHIQALPPDSDHLALGDIPLLTWATVAGNADDARAIDRCTALHIKTAAADARDLADAHILTVVDIPLLIGLADA